MNQKIIQIDAGELFGDFFAPDKSRNDKDGIEKYFEWPEEIGHGFMYTIKLRPGLVLGIGRYRLTEKIAISFGLNQSPVTLGFSVSGDIKNSVNYEEGQKTLWEYKQGYSVMTRLPECQVINRQPAGTAIDCVVLAIDPVLLGTFIKGQHDQPSTNIHNIINGSNNTSIYQTATITPAINIIIHQILNCQNQFPLKRLFFEGKSLELISLSMAQFIPSKAPLKNIPFLCPDEMLRIRKARKILIRSLETPPSLLELAKQVGINKDKLNQEFRQVFGTSVFDYLRIFRLERAKELLEIKQMNVTEAAFDVGYAHPENFTRAFKNHFGTKPKDHLL